MDQIKKHPHSLDYSLEYSSIAVILEDFTNGTWSTGQIRTVFLDSILKMMMVDCLGAEPERSTKARIKVVFSS